MDIPMTDLKEILDNLHTELATKLLEKVRGGEATAAELSVVRQFLKDNGIDSVPKKGSPIHRLSQSLPFTSSDDDEAAGYLPN